MNSHKTVAEAEPTPEVCWQLLERVAESSVFEPATRLRELLLYIGRRCIQEGCTQLREQEIGCAVFGRTDGYDTGSDNIVRTNVSHLRKRIEAYFSTEGINEPLVIEIPRGSYLPVFTPRLAASAAVEPAERIAPPFSRRDWIWKGIFPAVCVLFVCSLVIVAQYDAGQRTRRELEAQLAPWKSQPNLQEFWSNFYDHGAETDIVFADTSFSIFQGITNRVYPLNAYIDRSFTNDIKNPHLSADTRSALTAVNLRNMGNTDEFQLVRRLLWLNLAAAQNHLYNARDYSAANLNQHNAILIGSPIANPWTALYNNQLTFTTVSATDHNNIRTAIMNRAPASGEQSLYAPQYNQAGGVQIGYCVVALLPALQHNGAVLLIEGTTSEANEAAANLLLSESQLVLLKNRMHVTKFPYFEVLLKTTHVRSVPLAFTVEAYRTHQDIP